MIEKIEIYKAIEKIAKGEIKLKNILFPAEGFGLIQCENLKIYDNSIELYNSQIDVDFCFDNDDTEESKDVFIFKKD